LRQVPSAVDVGRAGRWSIPAKSLSAADLT